MSDHVDATFRNATSIASQGAAARRLDASLAKLSAASAVKPAPAPPARPDKVDLSGANVLRAFRDAAPFRDLGARLVDLRRLIASVGPAGPASSEAQSRIDASLASVRTAAASLRGASVDALASTTSIGPNIFNIRPGITDISVTAPNLGVGERLDINVIVVQSAQTGALRLSFGDSQLNLGGAAFAPSERFTVEIAGVDGSKELSFASGTSLTDVANVINTFAHQTGVHATVSGTGIRLASSGVGDDDFVSVRVLDDGGFPSQQGLGVYRYLDDDGYTADSTTHVAFDDTQKQPASDSGQDLIAFINGFEATTVGDTTIGTVLNGVKVRFDLGLENAQFTRGFRAFTIEGSPYSALDRVASLDSKGVASLDAVALLDDAIREVERAEREAILERGAALADGVAVGDVDAPVIREAQARLLEEARRLGLLVDHDPAKTIDALRP